MTPVAKWAWISSGAAPILLIGGWTFAASRQPASYDAVRDTISALAAHGASDRWIMTSALVGVGVCHVTTSIGLRAVRRRARGIYFVGGIATVLVAAFPQPSVGNSLAHSVSATVAITALSIWPLAARGRPAATALLGRFAATASTAVMAGLSLWFVGELHGGVRGLAERAATGAQALWPFFVVVGVERSRRQRCVAL